MFPTIPSRGSSSAHLLFLPMRSGRDTLIRCPPCSPGSAAAQTWLCSQIMRGHAHGRAGSPWAGREGMEDRYPTNLDADVLCMWAAHRVPGHCSGYTLPIPAPTSTLALKAESLVGRSKALRAVHTRHLHTQHRCALRAFSHSVQVHT